MWGVDYEKRILGQDINDKLILYKGCGCGYCQETGYTGRIGIYEIMELTRKHRQAIDSEATSDVLRDIGIENGMNTLDMECKKLVLQGVTTMEEFETITTLEV